MSFKTKDFNDSDVMRNFARIAKEKGLVKDKKITKQASVIKTLEPSGDLLVDISKLAEELRLRGYEKRASDLEKSFLLYKSAEDDLYGLGDQSLEELVEESHEDSDSEVAEAKDDLGYLENIIEQRKKDLEVINKEPTGKLSEAVNKFLHLKKIAQKADNPSLLNEAYKNINGVIDSLITQTNKTDDTELFQILTPIKNEIDAQQFKSKLLTSTTFVINNMVDKNNITTKNEENIIAGCNSIHYNIIGILFDLFNKTHPTLKVNLYNYKDGTIKTWAAALYNSLMWAKRNIQTIVASFKGGKTDVYVDKDLIDPKSLAAICDSVVANINKLELPNDEEDKQTLLNVKADFQNLTNFFTNDYSASEVAEKGETKNMSIVGSKLPQIISNKAYNIVRDSSVDLNFSISKIITINDFQNLANAWTKYCQKVVQMSK